MKAVQHTFLSVPQLSPDAYNATNKVYINSTLEFEYSLGTLLICLLSQWMSILLKIQIHKNIERHTEHTIASWPNPKQWQMGHTSDLMMIMR